MRDLVKSSPESSARVKDAAGREESQRSKEEQEKER